MDPWEKLGFTALLSLIIIITILSVVGVYKLYMPKEFNGYYIVTYESMNNYEYSIYINWDNGEDKMVFQTRNKSELIKMHKYLLEIGDPTLTELNIPPAPDWYIDVE
jgi:hypothetical protein